MELEICSIIKDEGRFLEEWIEFHLLQGVSRFCLYDNGSTDNTREVLRYYEDRNIVNLIEWPGEAKQPAMCENFVNKWKRAYFWCAFIDVDEFLCLRSGTVPMNLVQELSKYEAYGGLAVNWQLMGSSGHLKRPKGLVIANYTKGSMLIDRHVKTILNMKFALGRGRDVHSFSSSRPIINQNFEIQPEHYALSENPLSGPIQLFHFHVKSEEDYRFKCNRNRADTGTRRNFDDNFPAHDVNEVRFSACQVHARTIREILEWKHRNR